MKVKQFSNLPVIVHEVLKAIGFLAEELGYRAYLVGGIVRDMIIGFDNLDLDVAIEGDAIRFGKILAARTGSVFKSPTRFGTCKIESKAFGAIDLASTRSEVYPRPGSLPEVHPADIRADLERRDFTINAMAISLNPATYGVLVDPFGGYSDVRRGLLRVLHERSFGDDPTRMLRGVRFAARYSFSFDRVTASHLRDCLVRGCLRNISGERIFHEIELICREKTVRAALAMLARLGVLDSLDGFKKSSQFSTYLRRIASSVEKLRVCFDERESQEWVVWAGTLFAGLSKKSLEILLSRLRPPGQVRRLALWITADLKPALEALKSHCNDPYAITRILRRAPSEALPHLYALSGARERKAIINYACNWRHVKPSLSGTEIVQLGISEGPGVGRILERLTKLRLLGKVKNRQEEIQEIERYARKTRS